MTDQTPDKPSPDSPSEEQILALLLGETNDTESREIRAKLESDPSLLAQASRLQHAADNIKEALAQPGLQTDESAPQSLDPERRSLLLSQLSSQPTVTEKKQKTKLINFSHPFWGVGIAACLFFGLSIHLILRTGGLFDASHMDLAKLHELSVNEAPPPFPLDKEPNESYLLTPTLEEPPPIQLSQMESLLSPPDGNSHLRQGTRYFEDTGGQNRISRMADEIRNRRVAPSEYVRMEPMIQSDLQAFQITELPRTEFEFDADSPSLASTPIRTDLGDVGSAITVVTQEFMEDIGATGSSGGLQYTDDATFNSRSKSNTSLAFNYKEEEPLFGTYQVSEDEEIFELSPFTVAASEDSGYRSANTLAGSRLRTNLSDRATRSSSPSERYTFFTPDIPDLSEETRNQRPPKVTAPPPRLPFQSGSTPYANVKFDSVATTKGNFALSNKSPSIRFNLADGLEPLATTNDRAEVVAASQPDEPAPTPKKPKTFLSAYPETVTSEDPQSTFSLNVSDVSYRLAESYLEQNTRPPAGTLRTEEFINAFEYGDPTPSIAKKIGFAWERAHWPFAHDRDVIRFSLQTAAEGRTKAQPLNLVLAIDNSGSMSRPDRVEIVQSLSSALQASLSSKDRISVISFDREARLILDGQRARSKLSLETIASQLNPQGGTDLEGAIDLAYQTANRHFQEKAINRVILITDGAANLGNTNVDSLRKTVENNRSRGIALDCFGIGFDGHDDTFLESLSRNGDGRYRFLRSAEDAALELGEKLAGLLRPAAYDVKVQVEFNPERVELYQQLGYQQHQIADKDFRNNAIDAAELAATESGNALYLVKVLEQGRGDLGLVRVRYRDAHTDTYQEMSWNLPYRKNEPELSEASPALRLASLAAAFAALLNDSPLAQEIDHDDLFNLARPLPANFPNQTRVQELPNLIMQSRRL